ncbi:membrane protein [Pseudodonghicola xiamenensis]|uniref:O-antigen ligase like membrane protein n=1 Tax=Pseudodonghicola xiamenensis TaxID=337702 RepID=A0A8J3ME02_9RHOB|nr:membrane protein [Pseudodonghicola xiamenensis]GHG93603.1 hypothetical protein GCM10010961_26190 [Pseudodonghicola xiamenensis]
MPNAFAMLMLVIWPVICIVLMKRMAPERALIWCILGGYLVLPPVANFDLPLIPPMDKNSIPSVMAFLLVVLMLHRKVPLLPETPAGKLLVLMFLLGTIPTVLTNGEPVTYSNELGDSYTVQGLRVHDTLSVMVGQVIVLLPFLLGRALLGTEKGLRELLLATMVGGLIYTIPSLIEIRLSPQINVWVYGFFQHSFEQMMREGGFRPLVFLPHGLWLALFMFSALLSSAALARYADPKIKMKMIMATLYLAGVLYLCKSLASQLYAIGFVPLVLFTSPKVQIRIAFLLAVVTVLYPMLRNAGLIPLDSILSWASDISQERAASLQYRIHNEEILLGRAHYKLLFGWGGWGRNLLLDPASGQVLTVPDGRWIIVFGTFGWLGYIAEMGLLALPLVLLWRRNRGEAVSIYAAPVALIVAVTMVDMLLNATLIPLTWLCAGAVLGHAENPRLATTQEPRDSKPGLFGRGPAIGRRRPRGRRTVL